VSGTRKMLAEKDSEISKCLAKYAILAMYFFAGALLSAVAFTR